MKTSKQYHCKTTQDNTTWNAEIIRRVTAKKTVITKHQEGFATEAEAIAWGEKEVKALLNKTNQSEMKKRRAKAIDSI